MAVALDASDATVALRWARAVAPHVAVLKIGLELFYREGPAVVAALRDDGLLAGPGRTSGRMSVPTAPGRPATGSVESDRFFGSGAASPPLELFLDLKLHDIPATVAGGMRSVAELGARFVTVHATGGTAMIRAAVEAAPEIDVAAVTVLTSLDAAGLAAVGLAGPPADAVRRLAVLAVEAGARALVCSPEEIPTVRFELGNAVTLITPGVRPGGSPKGDQARTATPEEALGAGADLLVMGRPITSAADPAARAAAVSASLLGSF